MAILTFFLLCLIFLGVVYKCEFSQIVGHDYKAITHVVLLLPLLTTTTERHDHVDGRLLLDTVLGKGTLVVHLDTGEDESLLRGGDALSGGDHLLDGGDSRGGEDISGESLAGKAEDV